MRRGPYQKNKGMRCTRRGCSAEAYTKGLCKKHWQAQYMPAYRVATKERERKRAQSNRAKYRKSSKALATSRAYAKTPAQKKYRALYRAKNREKVLRWQRSSNYKAKYGITLDDYEDLLRRQRGRCAICGRKASEFKRSLHVDHCHRTRRIRGLLCAGCNITVGHLEKDSKKAAALLAYLGTSQQSDIPLNSKT